MVKIDRDKSGYIEFSEFLESNLKYATLASRDIIKHAFDQLE